VVCGFSQTFISGEIKGAYPRDNYIITSDLSVKFGDTLIFEAGSELRFKPNTGLTIRGVFIAEGKVDNTIVFTSALEQDVKSSGTTSQSMHLWKGVNLSASKVMSKLAYCLFCFCDTGLIIKNTFQKINLDHVAFHKNKSANIVWAGKPIQKNEDVQYIYRMDKTDNTSKHEFFPVKVASDFAYELKSHWKAVSRSTFSVFSLAGGGMWVVGYLKSKDYQNQYNEIHEKDENTQEAFDRLKSKRDQMAGMGNTGIAMCMVGTGAFLITFLF
jgi:hypothetical protein